jgi:hypothetical protein
MNLIRPSKQTMTGKQLDEMNDKFEDIENQRTPPLPLAGSGSGWRLPFLQQNCASSRTGV